MKFAALLQIALALALASCSAQTPASPPLTGADRLQQLRRNGSPITHVVIVVQENRTPDYLFQGVPGADIATTAVDSQGQTVSLHPVSLAAPYDLGHAHGNFVTDYDGGKMDDFDKGLPARRHLQPFAYAPRSEVQPYYDMATQYVFADRMFQSNQAGSFPAHQYLVSGTSSGLPTTSFNVSSDPYNQKTAKKGNAGCDAPPFTVVDTIDPNNGQPGPTPPPCFERPVLSDLLDQKGVKWRYYQNGLGTGLWHALDAIQHVRYGADYANVITPPQTILTDISKGRLTGVSWVMPATEAYSDHAGSKSAKGPSWVAAVVNAIGTSKYWKSTAIFVTWDDWGGWYDHYPPPQFGNYYELGCRVPLVVVSAYAKSGYVSHVQHEFGSILAFSEETFGIPKGSLGTTDERADDLMDAFDFSQQPRTFVPIQAPPFNPSRVAGSGLPETEDP
ncbi:MAG: alkaline phosphatase family protein [Candidatus Tumulicola sp.]